MFNKKSKKNQKCQKKISNIQKKNQSYNMK